MKNNFLRIALVLGVGLLLLPGIQAQRLGLGISAGFQAFPGSNLPLTRGAGLYINYWGNVAGGLRFGIQYGLNNTSEATFRIRSTITQERSEIAGNLKANTHIGFVEYVGYVTGDIYLGGLYAVGGLALARTAESVFIEDFPRYHNIVNVGDYDPNRIDVNFAWMFRWDIGYDFKLGGIHLLAELGANVPSSAIIPDGFTSEIPGFAEISLGVRF